MNNRLFPSFPWMAHRMEAIIAQYRGKLESVRLQRLAFEKEQIIVDREWGEWVVASLTNGILFPEPRLE